MLALKIHCKGRILKNDNNYACVDLLLSTARSVAKWKTTPPAARHRSPFSQQTIQTAPVVSDQSLSPAAREIAIKRHRTCYCYKKKKKKQQTTGKLAMLQTRQTFHYCCKKEQQTTVYVPSVIRYEDHWTCCCKKGKRLRPPSICLPPPSPSPITITITNLTSTVAKRSPSTAKRPIYSSVSRHSWGNEWPSPTSTVAKRIYSPVDCGEKQPSIVLCHQGKIQGEDDIYVYMYWINIIKTI